MCGSGSHPDHRRRAAGRDDRQLFRKWLRRLPHPFTDEDQAAGYTYDLSVLQAEFSLTQVLDRPQGQRFPALRFDDDRVQRLLAALLVFHLLPGGCSNRDLRDYLAPLLGLEPAQLTPGRMTYDLRRLRLHEIIERIPGRHRYRLTDFGLRVALFFTRPYARIVRDGLTQVLEDHPGPASSKLHTAFRRLEDTFDGFCRGQHLAA